MVLASIAEFEGKGLRGLGDGVWEGVRQGRAGSSMLQHGVVLTETFAWHVQTMLDWIGLWCH